MRAAMRRRRKGGGWRPGPALLALVALGLAAGAAARPGEAFGGAGAGETLPGPVPARVLRVVDGDTLAVKARVWPGHEVAVLVRLAGIDAAESHAACVRAREIAHRAHAFLGARVVAGDEVRLRDVRLGKYAGRVVARVETAAGEDLGAALLEARLARAYDGGRRRAWC